MTISAINVGATGSLCPDPAAHATGVMSVRNSAIRGILSMRASAECDCPAPLPGREIILRFRTGRAAWERESPVGALEGPALQIGARILFR